LKRLSLVVRPGDEGERLDRFIAERGGISRGVARRAIEEGGVFLDGRRCKVSSREVRAGYDVTVNLEEGGRAPGGVGPLERSRILFADEHLVAVDKPAGVPAQATLTSDRNTLPELVGGLLGSPVTLVHRLDRETSGVTVLARTREAAAALAEAFRTGAPHKTYLMLCAHTPSPAEGRTEARIGKDPRRAGLRCVTTGGDAAATRYRTLAVGQAALVEAHPETGRTHQIRVHLAHLGAPLLGDPKYGGPRMVERVAVPRVMLHALSLELRHPLSGVPLRFEAPLPADLLAVAAELGCPVFQGAPAAPMA
jgi:23S rRNA pseudouridine1911/1915/1917 synthase